MPELFSEDIKTKLSEMNINNEIIRKKPPLAVYETELNMIIHANGGLIDVENHHRMLLRVEAADQRTGYCRS